MCTRTAIRLFSIALLAACSGGSNGSQPIMAAATRPVNPPTQSGSGGTSVAMPGGTQGTPSGSTMGNPSGTTMMNASAGSASPTLAGSGGTTMVAMPTASGGASAPPPSGLPDVTFMMDVKIPAGAEQLKCLYAEFPADRGVIAVNSAESHYTPGSHHFLAYRSDLIGVPSTQTGVFDCQDGGFEHNKGSYYEAQQPDSSRTLPDGVAHKFQPNEVVILQAHYVNTMTVDVVAHITFILHTIDPATVQQEAGSILWSNLNISLPAHQRARITMTCALPMDFHPALLWSHMHHRGSNFVATTDDPAYASMGPIYAEPNWEEPQPREFPNNPPVTLHSGSHITFSCDFDNDTDNTITFGQSAQTNEMCILHGMYWPRNTTNGVEGCRGGMSSRTMLP